VDHREIKTPGVNTRCMSPSRSTNAHINSRCKQGLGEMWRNHLGQKMYTHLFWCLEPWRCAWYCSMEFRTTLQTLH